MNGSSKQVMNNQPTADLEKVVRTFWEAQEKGDRAAAREVLSEELVWRVAGDHAAVARTYIGVDSFFDDLIGTLGKTFVPGSVRMQLRALYTDEGKSTVISHVHETAQARNGKNFDVEIITLMRIEDGLISTCEEFMDLHEVLRVFGG